MEHHKLPGALGACRRSPVCMFLLLKCTDLCLLQPQVALFSLTMPLYCSQNNKVLNEDILCCPRWSSYPGFFSWPHACSLSWAAADDTEEHVIVATQATVTAVDEHSAWLVVSLQRSASGQMYTRCVCSMSAWLSDWSLCGSCDCSLVLAVQKRQITRWQETFPGFLLCDPEVGHSSFQLLHGPHPIARKMPLWMEVSIVIRKWSHQKKPSLSGSSNSL